MRELPTVTALIAAYNAEAFIAQALGSALAQDYPPELLDVLVIDDGSTDATAAIVEEHARCRPGRVRLVRQANGGNWAATERAIGAIESDLIAFLDADDAWPLDKTIRQVEALTPSMGLLYGDMRLVNAAGETLEESWLGLIAADGPPSGRCFGRLLALGTATSSSILMRTSLAKTLGQIPEGVPVDWWVSLRAAQSGEIGYLAEPRTLYRFHGNNRSLGSEGAVLRDAHLRRARTQRWFLRRIETGQATTAELGAAWESFEHNAAEAIRLSGSPFGAPLDITNDEREKARRLADEGAEALERGEPDGALMAYLRAAATDPWCDDAREGLAVALAACPGGEERPGQRPLEGARDFVVLAHADELLAAPWLLEAYAAEMRGVRGVTLALDATMLDPAAAAEALESLARHTSLDDVDVLGLPAPLDELGRARLAAGVHVLYSERDDHRLARPRVVPARLDMLRAMVSES